MGPIVGQVVGHVTDWRAGLIVLVVFGVAPGLVLRLMLMVYPRRHPRRQEILAELYNLDFHKQPFYVAQQFELAITEGLPARWRSIRHGQTADLPATGDRSALIEGGQVRGGTLDCEGVVRTLYNFLDGDLTVQRRHEIQRHLEECSPCLEAFDFQAEVRIVRARREASR